MRERIRRGEKRGWLGRFVRTKIIEIREMRRYEGNFYCKLLFGMIGREDMVY